MNVCKHRGLTDSYSDIIYFASIAFYLLHQLKVRQSRNDFFKLTILPKNEQTNSTLLLWCPTLTLVHLFSLVLWKKFKTPKRHFVIN